MKIASTGGAALFSLGGLQGCGIPLQKNLSPAPPSSDNLAQGQTVTSMDGTFTLTLPKGWQRARDLHDHADLQVSYEAEQLYIIVLRDLKTSGGDRLDLSINDHAILTLKALSSRLVEPTISPPTAVQRIGSYRARQVEVQGHLDSVAVTYLHTTIETRHAFYQILAWTAPEQFDSHREELQRVIDSFQELSQPLPSRDESEPSESEPSELEPSAPPENASESTSPEGEDNTSAPQEQAPSDLAPEASESLPDEESDRSTSDITNEPNPNEPNAMPQDP
ncbi:MAG TPA: hypothetical protein V6D20_18835 [Candidatus Obscuribacterales bacterium]